MSTNPKLNYEINLPEPVNDILDQDFWLMENLTAEMLNIVNNPVKFSSTVSIFLKKGYCLADLNLIRHKFEAPCIINIPDGHVLQPIDVSPDFEASFLVLSKKMIENVMLLCSDTWFYAAMRNHHTVKIDTTLAPRIEALFSRMKAISKDDSVEVKYRTLVYNIVAFLYNEGQYIYRPFRNELPGSPGRLTERFIQMVRHNFKVHRFLDFYAEELQVSRKHLSRTLKDQTGYTAAEWIDRFVILEACILLKSSNLHVQQIADELNFASQSFFGKYFKKHTGMSPREYRNKDL
ncbi:MAG: helix-turn-helix domain-containing protein [Muribaculum sp.]|nr:helix-turn-helix domain-containing protein [Muribaculum sp.]